MMESKRLKSIALVGSVLILSLGVAQYFINQPDNAADNVLSANVLSVSPQFPNKTMEPSAVTSSHPSTATEKPTEEQAAQDTPYQGPKDSTLIAKSMQASDYAQSSVYGELPPSLKGSSIPPLYVDEHGNLAADKSAKQFIEYFLSSAREESPATTIARMQEYFSFVLDSQAHTQALELLDNYMDYRYQLDAAASRNDIVGTGQDKINAVREVLDRRKQLRRDTLGNDVASAMFGDSEKYEDYAVNMMQTTQDDSLTTEEKEALYTQYEENLPPHIKERVHFDRQARQLEQQISQLKREQASDVDVYNLRKNFYGQEHAELWAYMEDNSDEWEARVTEFNQTKQQILASVMLNEEQKRQQINELRDRGFTQNEKLKMAWQALKDN